jgi:hypothetical protein
MIIATSQTRSGPLVILGLSEGNIVNLKDGKPVFKSAADSNLPFAITIVYGETEQDILNELKTYFGEPEAVINNHLEDPDV